VLANRKLILRGGAGIFSGRIPFVWISNQFTYSGVLFNQINVTDNANTAANEVNNGRGFEPDPARQSTVGSAGRTFEVNLIEKNFKLPQVARFNLATDLILPGGINATFEAMYSKTINNVFYQDINLTAPTGVVDPFFNNEADKRIAYAASTNARRINPNITNAILITNTNQGYTYNLTAQLSKTWKNVYIMGAYNYNKAKDVNPGTSSTALSNWEFVQVVGDPNNPGLSTSNYALTHRFTGVVSVNLNYTKFMRTSIGIFYSGNSGQRFTYLVNGDLNSDGRFGNDLMYVPNNPGEINFVDFLNADNTVKFTAAQQSSAFDEYINNNKYLRNRRGQYTERNGSSTPWEHVIDMRIAQDFYLVNGDSKHTLEVTFDIFNLTNLINREWGRQFTVTNQAYSILSTVSRSGGTVKGYNYTPNQIPWSMSFASRFQGQLGLRYSFN
jgi:hypothetical protein